MKNKIIAFFKKNPFKQFKSKAIKKEFDLNDFEYEQLKHILNQLVKESIIQKTGTKYRLIVNYKGKNQGLFEYINQGKGFGFVVLKDSEMKDIFIPFHAMGTAFHGDLVEVELSAIQKGKTTEGKVVRVLERNRKEIVGTFKKSKSFCYVQPDDKKIPRNILVPEKSCTQVAENDKVVVGNIIWDDAEMNPEGEIIEVIGNVNNYELEILSIARENNFPTIFSKEVEAELEEISEIITESEIKNRVDFRDEIVFTIDPEDAKDFDDALSIKQLENGNFQVGIHIADVSHFVKKGTELFEEALERATSVYFVGKVLPMLPEKISNKICSLVPDEDRLTFSVITEITPRGKVEKYEIAKTVINSKKRFTYEEANEILVKKEGKFFEELSILNKIANILRKKRFASGSINFHSNEVKFKLDENFRPISIVKGIQIETNMLIEEFMLLANKIVATYFKELNLKEHFIYRVHDLPDREKLFEFAKFVKSLGFSFDPNSSNKPKQFQQLLEQASGTTEEILINDVAIRSMAKAEYSVKNIGHYGLAFKNYAHFTSPIRRFPDLVVHQILFDKLNNRKPLFSNKEIEQIAEHSSKQERNAVNAERTSVKIKQTEFMKQHIGEVFVGIISGITSWGMFIELTETLTEGLIRLRDIDGDYFVYDESKFSLVGTRTGKKYRLGDKVKVKVNRVDEKRREIDFLLSDE